MKIIGKTSSHEMARRFAIGEVNSSFFPPSYHQQRQHILDLLTSGDKVSEVQGIQCHRQARGHFVDSIPGDTQWHLAKLDLSIAEFEQMRTIRDAGWIERTSGTLKLVDAANFLKENPSRDPRVAAVISACRQGRIELRGITLFAETDDGPFTVVEGTARLIALYLCYVASTSSQRPAEDIEVIWGISQTKWRYS